MPGLGPPSLGPRREPDYLKQARTRPQPPGRPGMPRERTSGTISEPQFARAAEALVGGMRAGNNDVFFPVTVGTFVAGWGMVKIVSEPCACYRCSGSAFQGCWLE